MPAYTSSTLEADEQMDVAWGKGTELMQQTKKTKNKQTLSPILEQNYEY